MAQTSLGTSAVTGSVKDATGAVVPGATVTLHDVEHGTDRTTKSGAVGEYTFTGMLPGVYTVKVEHEGFKTVTTNNLQVEIDQSATVNETLQTGDVTQTVEVNDAGLTPLLEQSSNSLGTVIDNKRVEELPLNGRNFLELAQLAGGTEPPTTTNQTGHPSNDNTIAIAGSNVWMTAYQINGIATRSPRIGNSSINLSLAAIDQFKIEYGFFLPDKGPQLGIVDIITKGGTNKFHGEAFEYLRNPEIGNAAGYFNNPVFLPGATGLPDNVKRNQFGGAFGGPAWIPKVFNGRDRFWFFVNYEGVRQVTRDLTQATVPTQAMLNGDFSTTGVNIYNPFLTVGNVRPQFQGNMIPQQYINATSRKLLAYYLPAPANYTTGVSGQLASYPRDTLNDDQYTIRLDGQLTQRQSAFVSWTYENSPVVSRSIFPLKGTTYPLQSYLATAQHTWSIGSRITNILRAGYNHALTFEQSEGENGPDLLTGIGITGTYDKHGISAINLTGYTGFGNAFSRVGEISNAYELSEALNVIEGKHSIDVGAMIIQHRTLQQNANSAATGSVSFQPTYSAGVTGTAGSFKLVANSGNSIADFLMGLPTSASVSGFQGIHYYFMDYNPYFEDSWKVAPNFTVNYGLAWYLSTIPDPRGSDAQFSHTFNFQTGLIQYAALGQATAQVIANDYNNFAPRLGFVYAPDKETTLRAGVGTYYGQLGLNDLQYASVAPPFSTAQSITNNTGAVLPSYSFVNGNILPVVTLPPLSATTATTLPTGLTVDAIDPHSRTPYTNQWYGAVQRTVGSRDLFEVDYIGSSSHKGSNRYSGDECAYQPSLFCDTTTRPFPQYAGVGYVAYNTNSQYEGVIAKYQHQLSHGLSATAAYTYQRTLLDGFEPNGPAESTQNPGCHSCDYGSPTYNIPQSLIVSVLYDLPVGRGKTFGRNMPRALNAVVGGWRVTTIGKMVHGSNDDVTSPASVTGQTGFEQRGEQFCNGNDPSFSKNVRTNGHIYINQSCYATPAAHYFGNSARGAVYDPGSDTWDASLVKAFHLTEGSRVEVRGDFFNVFNHTNFGNPDLATADKSTNKFGVITSAGAPRILQVSGRFVF